MSILNATNHYGGSDEPIGLLDLVSQFYTDQLRAMDIYGKGVIDIASTKLGWLRASMTGENNLQVSPDLDLRLSADDEIIQLFPFASEKDTQVAKDVAHLMGSLSDVPAVSIAAMGRMHLSFRGFPLQKPETWEEVSREHFQNVNRHWPYWLHFLVPNFKNYANLTALLCSPLRHKQVAGRKHVLLNQDDFFANLKRLITASLNLQTICNVPMKRRWHHRDQVVAMLDQCLVRD